MMSDLTEVPIATFGDLVIRLEMVEPGEKLQKKAKDEINETEENIKESIPMLQKLLRGES